MKISNALRAAMVLVCAMFMFNANMMAQTDAQSGEEVLLAKRNSVQVPFLMQCPPLELKAKSLINYRNYSKLYLRFKDAPNGQTVTLKSFSGAVELTGKIINSEVLFNDVRPNEKYQIITKSSDCAEATTVAEVSTMREDLQMNDRIELSNELYAVVREFQQLEGREDLIEYLEAETNISTYERTSFIQQYLLQGTPLTDDDGDFDYSKFPVLTTMCNCSLIMNGYQYVNNMWQSDNGSQGLGDNANSWWVHYQEGPAKYFNYTSDAWKDGTLFNSSEKSITKDLIGSEELFSQIGFTLFCYKSSYPYTCPCDKPVEVFYDYTSKVESDVHVLSGGGGSKKASGQAQDMAAVTLIRKSQDAPNNPEIIALAAGDLGVDVSCSNGSLNPDFFSGLANLAAPIVAIVGGDYTQIGPLVDELVDVAFTPTRIDVTSCDNESFTKTLFSTNGGGSKTVRISSGDEITILLSSHARIKTGGKRSWWSSMSIASTYYLAAKISSDVSFGSSLSCCSNEVIMWNASGMGDRQDDVNGLVLIPNGFASSSYTQGGWTKAADHPCIFLPSWNWELTGDDQTSGRKADITTEIDTEVEVRENNSEDEAKMEQIKADVKLSPNPVSDVLNISFDAPEVMMGRISVYNLTGQLIKTQHIEIGANYQLPVNDLLPQTYILRIEGENGFQNVQKFIKVN